MGKRAVSRLAPAAVAAALAVRTLPPWGIVLADGSVNFQEGDAWFHVRTVHNLLAHFPWRSGFDPYALFPGGQNIPTGPLWDYLIAAAAWVLGLGAPSARFTDRVAAWLPAILGALYVVPAYFLAKRLFGDAAAGFAAFWMALLPGGFLWYTHLGLADHHAAEGLFAFAALALLCEAMEATGAWRTRLSLAGGAALGAFLATRPAGVFVPAMLACAAAWEPMAAAPLLAAVFAAAVVFAPATGAQWSDYAWLSLAAAGACLGVSLAVQRRKWPRAVTPALVGAGLLAAGLARPALLASLTFEIRRVVGLEPSSRIVATVQEMAPIWRAGRAAGLASVVEMLGVVWIAALPMAGWVVWQAMRKRRPALRLFAIWAVAATAGTAMEARMLIYFGPVAAVLAGAAFARLADFGSARLRRAAWAILAAVLVLVNLPAGIMLMLSNSSPGADWNAALIWLRQNSAEPFGDGTAWSRYYRRRAPTEPVPATADWGVAVWWDQGYAVEQIAHRVPMSNGTQAGAEEMARFFTETSAESAVAQLRLAGARYAIVDPLTPLFAGENRSRFPTMALMAGHGLDDYFRVLLQPEGGAVRTVPVYLRAYYQTMAARLYLADGAAVSGTGPRVFRITTEGAITWSRHFDSEKEAEAYVDAHPLERLMVGCEDPAVSCFALPAVEGLRRVFSSDPLPISPERTVRAVKVFEVVR